MELDPAQLVGIFEGVVPCQFAQLVTYRSPVDLPTLLEYIRPNLRLNLALTTKKGLEATYPVEPLVVHISSIKYVIVPDFIFDGIQIACRCRHNRDECRYSGDQIKKCMELYPHFGLAEFSPSNDIQR